MRSPVAAIALSMLLSSAGNAQPLNPDISVIGDIRARASDRSSGGLLELHEVEFALVGPLNPYASGAVYAGVHGDTGLEIEEAKLMLDRYLPGGLGLTAGRLLLDFGQLNVTHMHAYPFLDRPLMHEVFFGEDGVVDAGARLDWIAPFSSVTLQMSAGALRGDVFLGGHTHGDTASVVGDTEAETAPKIGGSGRVQVFAEPSRDVALSVGSSVLRGTFDPADGSQATWISIDLKSRFDLGPTRTLVVNGEVVLGSLEKSAETAASDPNGWFASADLRTSKRWNLGGFAESSTERFDAERRTDRFGAFVGLALMEETTLFRVLGRRTNRPDSDGESEIVLQAIFGLGPHTPHRY